MFAVLNDIIVTIAVIAFELVIFQFLRNLIYTALLSYFIFTLF